MSQKCFIEFLAEPTLKSPIIIKFSQVLLCSKWRNLSIENDSKLNFHEGCRINLKASFVFSIRSQMEEFLHYITTCIAINVMKFPP